MRNDEQDCRRRCVDIALESDETVALTSSSQYGAEAAAQSLPGVLGVTDVGELFRSASR